MDRYAFRTVKTLTPSMVILDGYAQVKDASGGLTEDVVLPLWVTSITRNSTGNYTVQMADTVAEITFIGITIVGDAATDAVTAQPFSWVNFSGTKGAQFTFVVQNFSGAATDIVDNGGLFFDVHCQVIASQ